MSPLSEKASHSHKVMSASGNPNRKTPRAFLGLVRKVFGGPIILDPCADPDPKYQFAGTNFTGPRGQGFNGLEESWFQFKNRFINPPYARGKVNPDWANKVVHEVNKSRELAHNTATIVLHSSRTGSQWFKTYRENCDALCFWYGRLTFDEDTMEDTAAFDSAVFYFGPRVDIFQEVYEPHGWIVHP